MRVLYPVANHRRFDLPRTCGCCSRALQTVKCSGINAGYAGGLSLALPMTEAGAVRHIALANASPAKDAHVMTPVREIRLTFYSSRVKLSALDAVPDSARVAVAKVSLPLKNGTCTVQWKAVAADGAAGSGSFNFMYMATKQQREIRTVR